MSDRYQGAQRAKTSTNRNKGSGCLFHMTIVIGCRAMKTLAATNPSFFVSPLQIIARKINFKSRICGEVSFITH